VNRNGLLQKRRTLNGRGRRHLPYGRVVAQPEKRLGQSGNERDGVYAADAPEWWTATVRFKLFERTLKLEGQRIYKVRRVR
jgi:hypothetical protein